MGEVNLNEYTKVRSQIVKRVKAEMLGPGSEDLGGSLEREVITDSPKERYSLGILYPKKDKYVSDDIAEEKELMDQYEDSEEEEKAEFHLMEKKEWENRYKSGDFNDEGKDEISDEVCLTSENKPSAAGITFFAKGYLDKLNVVVSAARYIKSELSDCMVRINEDYDLKECGIDDYVYIEDGLLKIKDDLYNEAITDFIKKQKEKYSDLIRSLYKLRDLSRGYVRIPFLNNKTIEVPLVKELNSVYINKDGNVDDEKNAFIKITVYRKKLSEDIYSYTCVMTNEKVDTLSYKDHVFQPQISISTEDNNFVFIESSYMTSKKDEYLDDDSILFNILYKNKVNYSVGHGVATNQDVDISGRGKVFTDFFPTFETPSLNFNIEELKNSEEVLSMFNMSFLSSLSRGGKISLLNDFADSYDKWIFELEKYGEEIKKYYMKSNKSLIIIDSQIDKCRKALGRVKKGIKILESDDSAYNSFCLMNEAMLMQRVHSGLSKDECYPEDRREVNVNYYDVQKKDASWRAFQLAFILINIESITNPECDERELVDLIWIPTGGGKTEAYLGLIAFTIFLRRLKDPENGGGTAVIMRYTLRLLASQQFIRASILICACEKIRKENKKFNLGKDEISIGLWVGSSVTPNEINKAKDIAKKLIDGDSLSKKTKTSSLKDLKSDLDRRKDEYSRFQVLKCPWCGTSLERDYKLEKDGNEKEEHIPKGLWGYDFEKKKVIHCTNRKCDFKHKLPIYVVDEQLYENPPTLLFGTVDKFARLPWEGNVSNLFALDKGNKRKRPELIIQDELHLISGPLGSMAGLYETAVDAMCSYKGIKPKIIASTATIKRADEQCKMLFNRKLAQFPPSGLKQEDNFFSKEVPLDERPGRLYVGLMPAGKTATTTQVRLYTALLQSPRFINVSEDILDKYWTLVGYFNSLKELGKAVNLINDDIASNNFRYMKRLQRLNVLRYTLFPDELTSRVKSTQITKILKRLDIKYLKENEYSKDLESKAINIVLASNMISVGVDVDRLNLMVVSGQPKDTSEYIQATSRVGRSYPGVVFTLYNTSKTRDRSHYELFNSYHKSFYKYVEPSSLTPFSENARERGLHAVFVSLVRHILKLNEDARAGEFNRDIDGIQDIKEMIINRASDLNDVIDENISEIESELERIIEDWESKAEVSEQLNYHNNNWRSKSENLLVSYDDKKNNGVFKTMNSLRSIDSKCLTQVIEWEND